ncbi:MAG: DUF3109 family protein [Paludibacteraceae bacterium]|nr:DUF3109 family protein [Paludibacteraceae bacterium]
MFIIGDTLVSLDVLEKEFCCHLDVCKGCCCIEGDAGAPISEEECREVEKILPVLLPEMTKEARAVVEKQGISYLDPSGERVTSIVNDKDCVFARTDKNGWCYCLIEKAYNAGKIDFKKPISCHLYPVRVSQLPEGTRSTDSSVPRFALNYHRWDICHCARVLGKKEHIKLYEFLKEPLIRQFGQEWYDELCLTAQEWEKQCKQK